MFGTINQNYHSCSFSWISYINWAGMCSFFLVKANQRRFGAIRAIRAALQMGQKVCQGGKMGQGAIKSPSSSFCLNWSEEIMNIVLDRIEQFFMITILFCVPLHCPHGLKGTLAWAILISFILHFGILHFWYQVFSSKKEWASQWFCWMDELSWSLAALIKPPLLTTSQVYKPFKPYKPYKLTSPRHVRLLFNIITVYHYTSFKQ